VGEETRWLNYTARQTGGKECQHGVLDALTVTDYGFGATGCSDFSTDFADLSASGELSMNQITGA
jgi:hypothetical protein